MNLIQNYILELKETLDGLSGESIERVLEILHEARMNNQQVFIMGNGGSASTASHFACDLGKNTRVPSTPNFRVVGLTDNMALFSALANDEGYENVFSQQLGNYLQPGDVVIGISTSGNSKNVVNAIQLANSVGTKTIGFTGFDSGELGLLVDVNLHVPSHSIEHIEDIHLVLEHIIIKALREKAMEIVIDDSTLTILTEGMIKEEKSALD
jgi:D-sedoheptulose 7-phosphate isomerase